jgi:hypothetical protein
MLKLTVLENKNDGDVMELLLLVTRILCNIFSNFDWRLLLSSQTYELNSFFLRRVNKTSV